MRISFASEKGDGEENEDWCGATTTAAVVLDGLSAPGGGTGCIHGIPWYVRQLGVRLLREAAEPTDDLRAALRQAIRAVAELHLTTCDLSNPATPSTTVAVIREGQGGHLDYLVLADSVIILDGPEGVSVIADRRVDESTAEEQHEAVRHPVGSPEHEQAVQRMVEAQRRVRNRPGGYWVASADPAAADHAYTGQVTLSGLRRAALLSDGASRLVDQYKTHSWASLLGLLDSEGPTAVIRQVRAADSADPEGQEFGRYKASDDATAVVATWT